MDKRLGYFMKWAIHGLDITYNVYTTCPFCAFCFMVIVSHNPKYVAKSPGEEKPYVDNPYFLKIICQSDFKDGQPIKSIVPSPFILSQLLLLKHLKMLGNPSNIAKFYTFLQYAFIMHF